MTYTQCKLQLEPFNDPNNIILDTVYIPTKFAKKGKFIIVDKPRKRNAIVMEVYSTSTVDTVKRKTWDSSIPPRKEKD